MIFHSLLLFCQIPPFTAGFFQITADSSRTDTVRGTICFVAPWRVYYDVYSPVRQQLSVVKNVMTIYYPDETLAYVIRSKNQIESPLAQQSLSALNVSKQMAKMGFRLAQTRHCGETTYAVWQAKSSRMPFSHVTFGRVGRATVLVEVARQQSRPFLLARFLDHVRVDTFELPTRIETIRYDSQHRKTIEKLTYVNLDTSTSFLHQLQRFVLPQGVRTRNIEW